MVLVSVDTSGPFSCILCIQAARSLCTFISISGKTKDWVVWSVFMALLLHSQITILQLPPVNLLSRPKSPV